MADQHGLAATQLTDLQLFFTSSFDRALAGTATPIQLFRHALRTVDDALEDRFHHGTPAAQLVHQRAWYIDELLIRAWDRIMPVSTIDIALAAVGGYGRGELHPHSDIDLLILCTPETKREDGGIESLLAFLWDIGIKVSHSVRTIEECVQEAHQDVSIATNLMEARLLAGAQTLFNAMQARTTPPQLWPAEAFYRAKLSERAARHRKYHDTAYNLEPNVKEGPGGLRDLQTIAWIAQRHFGTSNLDELAARGFLCAQERSELLTCRDFLWKVRYGLHLQSGRDENRLLFDHQQALARELGYEDSRHRLAVEKFMKDYYRTITEVERLCELLLQLLHEAISPPECSSAQFSFTEHTSAQPLALNARFQARGDFLEVAAPDIFTRHPFALLEAFLLMQQHPELKGIAAGTIRLICTNRRLIDKRFRSDPHCRSLFTSILRQPRGLTHALRRMNRYGILGAYLPVFGQIVGQMQYDLFHTYTVDEHTLYVVRNLRRFLLPEHEHEFALCSRIARRIAKPELLYLAALFHDIAKGRGGDHSTLGADDAADFCMQHGLSDHDTRLVAWLVRHHLEMSTTAQHKDIDDPEVITAFARNVIDQEHLDHLYLLTVADIRATNPRLWNNWKDTLLKGLYFTTREALSRGLDNPLALRDQLANTQQAARALLGDIDAAAVQALWDTLDEEAYFLRHSPDEIAWHTRQILAHDDAPLPLIAIREQTERGGTEIFLYAKDQGHLFALATSALDQLGLNILSARVVTTRDGHTLDTYIVLDEYGHALRHPVRIGEVSQVLAERLANDNPGALRVSRRPARQLRHFLIPTEVVFSNDVQRRHTVMELVTVDRPGLLARVGRAFVKSAVKLQHAKIATFGERAEDVFLITDRDNHPLDMRRLTALRNRLMETLDEP